MKLEIRNALRSGSATSAISLIVLCAATQAQAQAPVTPNVTVADTAPAGLDDIVVTARKRAESLISVPVAVSALSQQDIVRYNATDLSKIAQLAPQVIIARGQSGGGANLVIRGLGSGGGDQALEQTVSINIDGVQVGRGRIVSTGFFDLAQVEILKGPQALYFGKNSPAGVISLTSAMPTDRLSGYIRSGYEFVADEAFVEGAVAGPITDTLKARLALRTRYMKGYLVDTTTAAPNPVDPRFPGSPSPIGRQPRTRDYIGRFTLQWTPTPDTDVVLRIFGAKSKEGGFTSTAQPICPTGIPYTIGGRPQPQVDCKLDKFTQQGGLLTGFPTANFPHVRADGKPYQDTKTSLSSLTVNQDFGQISLTSVTGYFDLDFNGAGNSGFSPLALIYASIGEHTRTFSQEFRLNSDYDGPVNFTLGAFYSHNKMSGYTNSAQIFTRANIDAATGKAHSYERVTNGRGETLSGFGQVRWNPIEQIEVAGGVRYTHETKSASTRNVFVNPAQAASFLDPSLALTGDTSEDNYSPEATLSYHPERDQTLYAAYKTGYKSGGISQPSVVSPALVNNILFKPEKIKGFELGYKAELFSRTVRFDLTLYSYKVSDLQVVTLNANTVSTLTNAASVRSKGIESNIQWRPITELQLRAGIGYNRARYLSFPNSPCYAGQTAATGCTTVGAARTQNLSGRELPRAPKISAMAGFTFDQPVGNDLTLGIDGDVNYTSKVFPQDNLAPLSVQPAYTLINAGVRIGQTGDGWQLALIGRNLTNKYYRLVSVDAVVGSPGTFGAFTARPREIAIQGSYRF